jgi:hypothetical protein
MDCHPKCKIPPSSGVETFGAEALDVVAGLPSRSSEHFLRGEPVSVPTSGTSTRQPSFCALLRTKTGGGEGLLRPSASSLRENILRMFPSLALLGDRTPCGVLIPCVGFEGLQPIAYSLIP